MREHLRLFDGHDTLAEGFRYVLLTSAAELVESREETAGAEVVESGSMAGVGEVVVGLARASGIKCERCWNYSEHVGEHPVHVTLCERCTPVVVNDFPDL